MSHSPSPRGRWDPGSGGSQTFCPWQQVPEQRARAWDSRLGQARASAPGTHLSSRCDWPSDRALEGPATPRPRRSSPWGRQRWPGQGRERAGRTSGPGKQQLEQVQAGGLGWTAGLKPSPARLGRNSLSSHRPGRGQGGGRGPGSRLSAGPAQLVCGPHGGQRERPSLTGLGASQPCSPVRPPSKRAVGRAGGSRLTLGRTRGLVFRGCLPKRAGVFRSHVPPPRPSLRSAGPSLLTGGRVGLGLCRPPSDYQGPEAGSCGVPVLTSPLRTRVGCPTPPDVPRAP